MCSQIKILPKASPGTSHREHSALLTLPSTSGVPLTPSHSSSPSLQGLWGSSEAELADLGWGNNKKLGCQSREQRQQEGLGVQLGTQQGCSEGSRPFLTWLSPNSRRCSSSTLVRLMARSTCSSSGPGWPRSRL